MMIAPMVLILVPGQEPERDPEIVRASGECRCKDCGDLYRRHPWSCHRSWNETPYLHVLCDLTLVKL